MLITYLTNQTSLKCSLNTECSFGLPKYIHKYFITVLFTVNLIRNRKTEKDKIKGQEANLN